MNERTSCIIYISAYQSAKNGKKENREIKQVVSFRVVFYECDIIICPFLHENCFFMQPIYYNYIWPFLLHNNMLRTTTKCRSY